MTVLVRKPAARSPSSSLRLGAATAAAQDPFLSRPIKLVVLVAAGGASTPRSHDARVVGSLGQQVVVENKPGGGQVLGSDLVAKSKPTATLPRPAC
jgi:tripartite-type tricarboxylate transporter receptor subunit TctC